MTLPQRLPDEEQAALNAKARSRGVSTDVEADPLPRRHGDADHARAGFELYRIRPDNGFSLVDCISMQTMRQAGLIEVLLKAFQTSARTGCGAV